MSNPQIVSAIIGLLIGGGIFWLVRRDHLVTKDGIRWMIVAIGIVIFGFVPKFNDMLGAMLGINYPPIIPVLLGIGAILIKLLLNDIEKANSRMSIERLIQRVAMLEAELEQAKLINREASKKETADNEPTVKDPVVEQQAINQDDFSSADNIAPLTSRQSSGNKNNRQEPKLVADNTTESVLTVNDKAITAKDASSKKRLSKKRQPETVKIEPVLGSPVEIEASNNEPVLGGIAEKTAVKS